MNELNEKELNEVSGGGYKNHEDYYCVPGDTLERIAWLFQTTPEYLINLNNLTSINLTVGQHLLVPKVKRKSST
ncbi:MAG: LysM peptidoglycan-binding domain-containing protein [Eubacteriales bacterium]|nr:LysM peptidoglycan-binding domain-containing protein [Eubacteriales bacterium]